MDWTQERIDSLMVDADVLPPGMIRIILFIVRTDLHGEIIDSMMLGCNINSRVTLYTLESKLRRYLNIDDTLYVRFHENRLSYNISLMNYDFIHNGTYLACHICPRA
jgi:hypothetical protein